MATVYKLLKDGCIAHLQVCKTRNIYKLGDIITKIKIIEITDLNGNSIESCPSIFSDRFIFTVNHYLEIRPDYYKCEIDDPDLHTPVYQGSDYNYPTFEFRCYSSIEDAQNIEPTRTSLVDGKYRDYLSDMKLNKSILIRYEQIMRIKIWTHTNTTILKYLYYLKDDLLHGCYCQYHVYDTGSTLLTSTRCKIICYYNLGKLDGPYIEYDIHGKVIYGCNYKNGEIFVNYGYMKLSDDVIATLDILNKDNDDLSIIDHKHSYNYTNDARVIRLEDKNGNDMNSYYDENLRTDFIVNEYILSHRDRFYKIKYYRNKDQLKYIQEIPINGTHKTYHMNGRVCFITDYANGVQNGPELKYDINGLIEIESFYLNNKLHGIYKGWKNGILLVKITYSNGMMNGLSEEYHSNGSVYKRLNFKNDMLDGTIEKYDSKRNLVTKSEYKNDKLHGEYKVWDSDNDLITHKVYKDGNEIERYVWIE